jgi:hypothetical protein
MGFGSASRCLFFAIIPLVLLLGPSRPNAVLVSFFTFYALFWVFDGIASVGWLDILGKCLTVDGRSRLITVGQAGGAVAGVLVGIVVSVVLEDPRLGFPANYVLIFLLAGLSFGISLASFSLLKEAPEGTRDTPLPLPAYFRRLGLIARQDADFRRAVAVQVLCGMMGMATPFYVIYGLEELGFSQVSVGVFTSASVAGGIGWALILGYLGVRRGTRAVMRAWGFLAPCAPVAAIVVPIALRGAPALLAMYAYTIVFLIVGAQGTAAMAGFTNYVIELAPPSVRPMYIGLANALNGILLIAPLLGGMLLSAGLSYPALFAVAAAFPVAGILVSRGLAEPRERPQASPDASR